MFTDSPIPRSPALSLLSVWQGEESEGDSQEEGEGMKEGEEPPGQEAWSGSEEEEDEEEEFEELCTDTNPESVTDYSIWGLN